MRRHSYHKIQAVSHFWQDLLCKESSNKNETQMNRKSTLQILGVALLSGLALAFSNCKKSDDSGNSGTAQMSVRLTDGPADYDAIWLDIRQVEVITEANGSVTLTP